MSGVTVDNLAWAWAQQRIWSQTANRLKRRIDRARAIALGLAIAAAACAVSAVQFADIASWLGRTLAAAAAVCAGVGTISQRGAGTDQIRTWTRARSASEGLKTELYLFLGGGSSFLGEDRQHRLSRRARGIVDNVAG